MFRAFWVFAHVLEYELFLIFTYRGKLGNAREEFLRNGALVNRAIHTGILGGVLGYNQISRVYPVSYLLLFI
jgi:hypothetical protein